MNDIYPLKFNAQYLEKIWGGQKISKLLGQEYGDISNCGEMWVLSGVEGKQSVVSNGFLAGNELNELVEIYMDDLVGEQVYAHYGNEFPILLKFLDSNDWLSVQVHPDDEIADRVHGAAHGKTEMWYVIQADKGAQLISGFTKVSDRAEVLRLLESGHIKDILHHEEVSKNDVFFTPAGRIHAIGPGLLLAEIQQSSDHTYRIWDWERPDNRELHTELALNALNYNDISNPRVDYLEKENATVNLVSCPQFTTNLIRMSAGMQMDKDFENIDSFVIYLCTEGSMTLKWDGGIEILKLGECVLIPAAINNVQLISQQASVLLEVYIIS